MLVAGLFGHGQQGVDRQHGHALAVACPEGQALGHGAGRAQPGERARPPAKNNQLQGVKTEPGLGQQPLNGRNQRGRGLRPPGRGVLPYRIATLDGDGEGVGAGVKGEQVHGPG